eukprot:scaffold448888_cov42-Prasinocladus_malaysianus.AAC.2
MGTDSRCEQPNCQAIHSFIHRQLAGRFGRCVMSAQGDAQHQPILQGIKIWFTLFILRPASHCGRPICQAIHTQAARRDPQGMLLPASLGFLRTLPFSPLGFVSALHLVVLWFAG